MIGRESYSRIYPSQIYYQYWADLFISNLVDEGSRSGFPARRRDFGRL